MAGIGFEMRKLLERRTLVGATQAYLFAGILSCGPWIISIFSIAVLNLVLQGHLSEDDRTLLSTTITHAYALALILTGALHLVLTRHAADALSKKQSGLLMPTCLSALVLAGGISLVGGVILFGFLVNGTAVYKIGAITLHTNVAMIFVCTNYLGALQRYRSVVLGFVVGYLGSCFAAWFAASHWGVPAAVFAFSLGHGVLLGSLLWLLKRELDESEVMADWGFLRSFRRFPELAFCGLFYNVGIWIDKILFWWFSERTLVVNGALHAAPAYDLAIYLSLLSIVPGFAVFLLTLETRFATAFHRFFEETNGGGTLREIEGAKSEMIQSLRSGFSLLFAVQGGVTLVLLVFADQLAAVFGIGALQLGIFRVTLIGAFLLIIFLSMLTILFYLDDRRGALVAAAIFGIGNAVLSGVTLLAYEAWYGAGFVVAAAMATFFAAVRVNSRVTTFEHFVFTANLAK